VTTIIDWIKDTWWLIWHKDFTLLKSEHLNILISVSRWNGQTGAIVFMGRPTIHPGTMLFRAYEVADLTPEGHDQLVRLLELPEGPSQGQITVWLWHQGVHLPVETFHRKARSPRPVTEEP
jgi:hypothetical protein